ncbi:MAG: methyl-accepting chemotaxis protein [Gammaproteobacteria bacterium]|nr:methyl-accepting chemotaxis protein [Gammaproteobacteria bacterium]
MKVNLDRQSVGILVSVILTALVSHAVSNYVKPGNILFEYLIIAITALLIGAMAVFAISRLAKDTTTSILEQLTAISQGSKALDSPISASGGATSRSIATQYNQIISRFSNSLGELKNTTNELAFTASNLATVTERTEANTLRQQNETDLVATAMNEMTSTVEEVARNAEHASSAARDADTAAGKGFEVANQTKNEIDKLVSDVRNASEVIARLEAESQNIGAVLDVIKGIAEQTNLLALNAAIEAARAGEQGRGFAVVADEVRTLASRTQESTSEIEEMIGRLQSGVDNTVSVMQVALEKGHHGSQQVDATLQSLKEILDAVGRISDMNTQIATAAEEQSQVANEINGNIVNISTVATETTQDARESRETSVKLAGISMTLSNLVGSIALRDTKGLDLSTAKAAHLNWKTRLRDFLDGKEALTTEQAVSHRHCDFGKWYYSEGLKNYGHLGPIVDVEKPHEELHKLIKNIVELKSAGKVKEAEKAYQKVAEISGQIVGHLSEAERQA